MKRKRFTVSFDPDFYKDMESLWKKENCDTNGEITEGKLFKGQFFGNILEQAFIENIHLRAAAKEQKTPVGNASKSDKKYKKKIKKLENYLGGSVICVCVLIAYILYARK